MCCCCRCLHCMYSLKSELHYSIFEHCEHYYCCTVNTVNTTTAVQWIYFTSRGVSGYTLLLSLSEKTGQCYTNSDLWKKYKNNKKVIINNVLFLNKWHLFPVALSLIVYVGNTTHKTPKKQSAKKDLHTNDSTLLQKCLRLETSLLQNTPLTLMGTASILTVRDFKKDFSGRFFAENRYSAAY